ncbi:MAG: hypothetical protein GX640_15605 [Fibrobacter sp.]|nr:hypothetical protein [Fibrobacter sp.]
MPSFKFFIGGIFLFILSSSSFALSYSDDSLVIVEILKANGLESTPVQAVAPGATGNSRITSVSFSNMGLKVLPECIGELTELQYLNANDNFLYELPLALAKLTKLKDAYFIRNRFTRWPEVFHQMPTLELIDVGGNHLSAIPPEVSNYTTLKRLYINDNYLKDLPEQLTNLNLEVIHVAGNALCHLSTPIQTMLNNVDYYKVDKKWLYYQSCDQYWRDSLRVQEILTLNGWTNIPVDSVITMVDGNIVGLDLSFSRRTSLNSGSLPKRTTADISKIILSNQLVSMKYLEYLNLSQTGLDTLPDWFASLCHLKELNLSGNNLKSLPAYMPAFGLLEKLDLSSNKIENLIPDVKKWADLKNPGWEKQQLTTSSKRSVERTLSCKNGLKINHISNRCEIEVTLSQSTIVSVSVYSLSGQRICGSSRKLYSKGRQIISFDIASLPHGVYTVVVQTESLGAATLRTLVN